MGILLIGPLHDPVTWYGINYTGTQITQWDFQNKGTCTSPARLSFVLNTPTRDMGGAVASCIVCFSPDRAVRVRVLAWGIVLSVFLDKTLDSNSASLPGYQRI